MKLVGELVARTAASGAFRVAALDHEIRDHAMKNSAVVERLAGLGAVRQGDEFSTVRGALSANSLTLNWPSVVSKRA